MIKLLKRFIHNLTNLAQHSGRLFKRHGHKVGHLVQHPGLILVGVAIGIYIGLLHKDFAVHLNRPGNIYLKLLQMCVLPIMISAVILSVGRMFSSGSARRYVGPLVLVIAAGMILSSSIGVITGIIGGPGNHFSTEQKILLGKEIVKMETDPELANINMGKRDVIDFLSDMIPTNIFYSASTGETMPILFFCVVIGIALGLINIKSRETVIDIAEAMYEALLKVISWIEYGLPLAVACLFGYQISSYCQLKYIPMRI